MCLILHVTTCCWYHDKCSWNYLGFFCAGYILIRCTVDFRMLLYSAGIMKNVGEIIRIFCDGCILVDVPLISGCDYILLASCQM
jgi:hypothetical protein